MSRTCPRCRMDNGESARFCRHCANPLSDQSRPLDSQGSSASHVHQEREADSNDTPPQSYDSPPSAPVSSYMTNGSHPGKMSASSQASYGSYPQPPAPQPYVSYASAPQLPPQASYETYPSSPPQEAYGAHPTPPHQVQLSNAAWQVAPAYPSGQYANANPAYGHFPVQMAGPGPNPCAHVVPASAGARIAAYLIDCIPVIVAIPVLILVSLIPLIGGLLAFALYAPYWMLRDITGASMGKRAMGLEIIQVDGTPPRKGPRVLRNLPLYAPALLHIIPLVGPFLHLAVGFVVVGIEIMFVICGSRRIGDRLAGTMVVRKRL